VKGGPPPKKDAHALSCLLPGSIRCHDLRLIMCHPPDGSLPSHPARRLNVNAIIADRPVTIAAQTERAARQGARSSPVILDANQCAIDPGQLVFDSTTQADIRMDSESSDAGSELVSLFQTNGLALKAERTFAYQLLRSTGAAVVSANASV
jgi:hypothetical protein